jgi:hypothetical protein
MGIGRQVVKWNGTEIAKFKFMTLNEQTAMDVIKNQKSKGNIISNETRIPIAGVHGRNVGETGEK